MRPDPPVVDELALAWQKLAIYQQGHPERAQAVGRAHAVLVGLIAPTGTLALGVSSNALIGPEEKLTSPPAARLAASLYLLEGAGVRFDEGRPQVLVFPVGVVLEAVQEALRLDSKAW